MHFCYVDEAGCTGILPSTLCDIQPVLAVVGISFHHDHLLPLTREFMQLKRQYFPGSLPAGSTGLDWIKVEIKGSELRRQVVSPMRKVRRHGIGFLDRVVDLLERHECRIKGRVWVKGIGQPFNGRSVYTSSVQYIHLWFEKWLAYQEDQGLVICDSRNKHLNTIVSHSIFTEKYRAVGDKHPRIMEMPTFGHSENHAGLQLADLVCSALLFPMAIDAYCKGKLTSIHVRAGYDALRQRYGARLEQLQYRLQDPTTKPPRLVGGVMVADQIGMQPRHLMFR